MRPSLLLLVPLCVLAQCVSAGTQQRPTDRAIARFVPGDEASSVPSAAEAIASIRQAALKRDEAALLRYVSDSILVEESPRRSGRAAFSRYWRLDDSGSAVWPDLARVLAEGSALLGCGVGESNCLVVLPYWSERFPYERFDRLQSLVVRSERVALREQPSEDAKALATVGYEIVFRNLSGNGEDTETWTRVKLADGTAGFVAASDLYDPTFGLRVILSREARSGRWQIVEMREGD